MRPREKTTAAETKNRVIFRPYAPPAPLAQPRKVSALGRAISKTYFINLIIIIIVGVDVFAAVLGKSKFRLVDETEARGSALADRFPEFEGDSFTTQKK